MNIKQIKESFYKELPFFMMAPALSWQVLFFYLPFCVLILLSFFKLGVFSLHNYSSLLNSAHFFIIGRSLFFALANAFICLFIAYPAAYFIARHVKRKHFFIFLFMLPFWTNILVQIYAWFFILERNGLLNALLLKLGIIDHPLAMLNTMPSILLVMTYCYLPFMIMPLYTALEKIDERLIEASYDLGAHGLKTFFNITLPLSWPGIKTGFFLVLVPSFGEFVIPSLVGGSKYMFAGSLISHYFLNTYNTGKGAAFTCLSGLCLLIVALGFYSYFQRKVNSIRG